MDEEAIGIRELAERLGRKPHTIRQWIRERALPRELRPKRDGGRRQLVWSPDQVPGLVRFAEERASRKGWGH